MSFNPAQQKQLETWAEQRDKIIQEIGSLSTERDSLLKENKEHGLAYSDLQKSIAEAKGRLLEINAVEERFKTSLSLEVTELIARKGRLESEIETKNIELKGIEDKKKTLLSTIDTIISLHDKAFDRIGVMDEMVSSVKLISQDNIFEMKQFLQAVKTSCEEIVAVNRENVATAKIVLDKFSKFIFEIQKPIPLRNLGRGNERKIEPVNIKSD